MYPICKAHDISIGFPLDSHEITVKSPFFQHLEGIFPDFPIFSLGFPYDFPMPNLGSQATSGSAPCHLVPSRGPTWTAPTWAPRNGGSRPGSPSAMWGLSHWKTGRFLVNRRWPIEIDGLPIRDDELVKVYKNYGKHTIYTPLSIGKSW